MSAPATQQPDAAILEAFEKVRSLRAFAYSFDPVPDVELDEKTRAAIEAGDNEMIGHEATVHATSATTIAGVIARLQLAIPAIDQERWIDKDLMQLGLLAIASQADNMGGGVQQVTLAAADLMRIDWQQALDACERSSADFKASLDIKALAEREMFAKRREDAPSEFAEAITEAIEAFSNRLMDRDCRNIERLFQTPAPDWQAYRQKAEIAIREGLAAEASTWLLRDANALLAAQGEA